MDERARRQWAAPPATGEFDDVDLALLDPADEDERRLLIEAEHPELAAAVRRGQSEMRLDGRTMNPTLHLTLHQVVAQQIWDDDPQQTWQTALRLTALGHDRHEVLHMLMFVVGEDIRRAVIGERPRNPEEIAHAFEALPAGWA